MRTSFGRSCSVVPVRRSWLVAEYLRTQNEFVVVRETHFIGKAGVKSEVAIVQDAGDKLEQVDIIREDTAENSRNLQGSVLDDGDTTTPAMSERIAMTGQQRAVLRTPRGPC